MFLNVLENLKTGPVQSVYLSMHPSDRLSARPTFNMPICICGYVDSCLPVFT